MPSAINAGRSALSPEHRQLVREQREELWATNDDMPACVYLQEMSLQGTWGTGLEALAAAYHFRRPVHVWSPSGHSELRPPASVLGPETPIYLFHNGHDHWDSLRPLFTSSAPRDGRRANLGAQLQGDIEVEEDEQEELDLARVLSLSLLAESGFQRTPRPPPPPPPPPRERDASEAASAAAGGSSIAAAVNESMCIATLVRLGLSNAEAAQALAACGGDVESVKSLYGIGWGSDTSG